MWEAVVYPIAEVKTEDPEVETIEQLKARAVSRADVKQVCEYLRTAQKRDRLTLDEKIRVGYLLHVCGDEEEARSYLSTINAFASTGDLQKFKSQLHVNLGLLKQKQAQKRIRAEAPAEEVAEAPEEPAPEAEQATQIVARGQHVTAYEEIPVGDSFSQERVILEAHSRRNGVRFFRRKRDVASENE